MNTTFHNLKVEVEIRVTRPRADGFTRTETTAVAEEFSEDELTPGREAEIVAAVLAKTVQEWTRTVHDQPESTAKRFKLYALPRAGSGNVHCGSGDTENEAIANCCQACHDAGDSWCD